MPEPVYLPFRGRETRVRHDDPTLKPYTPMAAVLRSAANLASDVHGLRRALETTVGERYRIEVPDDGSEVRLRRRAKEARPPARAGLGLGKAIPADERGLSGP